MFKKFGNDIKNTFDRKNNRNNNRNDNRNDKPEYNVIPSDKNYKGLIYKKYDKADKNGADIAYYKQDLNDDFCLERCNNDSNCAGIAINTNNKECWLKNNSMIKNKLIENTDRIIYEKNKENIYNNGFKYEKDYYIDIPEYNIKYYNENLSDDFCIKKCNDDINCGGVAMNTNRKECWLKDKSIKNGKSVKNSNRIIYKKIGGQKNNVMKDTKSKNIIIESKYENDDVTPLSNSYIKFSNSDSENNDIFNYGNISIDQCFLECNLNNNCNGFTYNSNNCILKNKNVYPNGGMLKESFNNDLYVKQPADDIKKLIFDNPIYRASYIAGSVENPVGYKDDLTTAKEIIDSINVNLSQLNYIQNQLNLKNNVNQEALLKQEELLKMENDDLMNQLKTLENIESIISNKDRMIEQTNKNIEQTNVNIKLIIITIIIAIIIFIFIILFGYGIISSTILTFIITFIVIAYLFLYCYFYNIFNIRDIFSYMMNKQQFEFKHSGVYLPSVDSILKKANIFEEDEESWIKQNCSCKNNNTQEEYDDHDSDSLNPNYNFNKLSAGYFYYDEAAPPQLLLPSPENTNVGQINWVDYSENGVIRFSNNTQNEDNNNNNYYNYGNNADPKNKLINELNRSHSLVNNITYTKNM